MPNLDIRSDLEPQFIMNHIFTDNTPAVSSIVDQADFEGGIMFIAEAPLWADGTYTFTIYESDDSGMAGKTLIPTEKIIDDLTKLTITAATVAGAVLPAVGVFSTKRYLEVTVTPSGVGSGATIVLHAIKKAEYMPVTNQ